jgi:hypothetical protein
MEEETVVSGVAQQLLNYARAELARADDKASSVLGAVSALVAVAAVAPNRLQPGRSIDTGGWACGLSICALAMILLMFATLPRFAMGSRRHVCAYFGHMSKARHKQELEYLITQLAKRPSEAVLSELRTISRILITKYQFTQLGILCAVAGGVLLVTSTL